MNKDISFGGLSTVPSDYECADGDLAAVLNLVPEDGSLKPVQPPTTVMTLSANMRIVYIHKTSAFTHYIIFEKGTNYLYWMNSTDASLDTSDTSENRMGSYYGLKHCNAVGNTLLAFLDNQICYFLWSSGKYTKLGNHLPNIEISFGLKGYPRFFSLSDESKSTFTITFDEISDGKFSQTWTESNKTKITEQVLAKVNKFLKEQTIDKGRFALPFFVRYALRLYDGSLVCHSAPILMNPSTGAAPVVLWNKASGEKSVSSAVCDIMLVAATLDYKLIADRESDWNNMIENWGDIIKSVDVFISKPIYTWDQSGQCTSFVSSGDLKTKFIGALCPKGYTKANDIKEDYIILPITTDGTEQTDGNPSGCCSFFTDEYYEWEYSTLYAMYLRPDRTYPNASIQMPEFSDEKVKETLENTSAFYKLCSLELSELSISERKDIEIEDDYLQSLVNREVMTDDYLTHDQLAAKSSHAYNSRLNLSGVKRKLFRGFYANSMFAYKSHSGYDLVSVDTSTNCMTFETNTGDTYPIKITVYIKENGETYGVEAQTPTNDELANFLSVSYTSGLQKLSWGCYVFYPNTNAFKMVISDNVGFYQIDLKAHEFLNGAFAVLDYDLQRKDNFTNYLDADGDGIVSVPNKIYTSEVNNPFYFPLSGINTVGTGNIIGISSAVKALSQGQFGQFPLYAFTDEGVWALEVSTSGTYSAKQPVTRDVCINADSITQLDSSVLFATDRGLMLIEGSQTVCLSDILNGENILSVSSLPKMDSIAKLVGFTLDDFTLIPFIDFVKKCRSVYDYTHQRIIVYNASCTYAYVYSLKSKKWGMMQSTISDNVNSYPDALAVLKDGALVNFSVDADDDYKGIAITRPFKLDAPDVMKTVSSIIQRGFFRKGHMQCVLYASRDLFNWFVVWSSQDHYLRGFSGTPYKYYRLALLCTLADDEELTGCSVEYTPRQGTRQS